MVARKKADGQRRGNARAGGTTRCRHFPSVDPHREKGDGHGRYNTKHCRGNRDLKLTGPWIRIDDSDACSHLSDEGMGGFPTIEEMLSLPTTKTGRPSGPRTGSSGSQSKNVQIVACKRCRTDDFAGAPIVWEDDSEDRPIEPAGTNTSDGSVRTDQQALSTMPSTSAANFTSCPSALVVLAVVALKPLSTC